MPSTFLRTSCCCCSLRAGSLTVGWFSTVFALIFSAFFATSSELLRQERCTWTEIGGKWIEQCKPASDMNRLLANILAMLALANTVQFGASIALIWGATKKILNLVTTWLVVSIFWTFVHSAVAIVMIAYLCDASYPLIVSLVALASLFSFGVAALSLLTVNRFRDEILSTQFE